MATTLKIVNGDITMGTHTGRPQLLSGAPATKQHIVENLTIDTQANGFGAGIGKLVGTVPADAMTLQLLFVERIRSSFNVMRALQIATQDIPRELDEMFYSVQSVRMTPVPTDHRAYVYYINVLTEAGAVLSITDTLLRS